MCYGAFHLRNRHTAPEKNSSNIIFIVSARIVSFNVFAIGIGISIRVACVPVCMLIKHCAFAVLSLFS